MDGREYTGHVTGQFVGLDLVQPMYIGGVPNYQQIARASGHSQGFVGLCTSCM